MILVCAGSSCRAHPAASPRSRHQVRVWSGDGQGGRGRRRAPTGWRWQGGRPAAQDSGPGRQREAPAGLGARPAVPCRRRPQRPAAARPRPDRRQPFTRSPPGLDPRPLPCPPCVCAPSSPPSPPPWPSPVVLPPPRPPLADLPTGTVRRGGHRRLLGRAGQDPFAGCLRRQLLGPRGGRDGQIDALSDRPCCSRWAPDAAAEQSCVSRPMSRGRRWTPKGWSSNRRHAG